MREIDGEKYMLSYSHLSGKCENLLIWKNNHRVGGTTNGRTIGETIDALHQEGIFGYEPGLERTAPTVFFDETNREVDDFLQRRPERYVIRNLNPTECVISYLNATGHREDTIAKRSIIQSDEAKGRESIGNAIGRLHEMGRVGYYKGLEEVPPPVPKWVDPRGGDIEDAPPPAVPPPF
jgi:hypothetical protein